MANETEKNENPEGESLGEDVVKPSSGWNLLRKKFLKSSPKCSAAFDKFTENLQEKCNASLTELQQFRKGESTADGKNESISSRIKSINDMLLGMSMDADSLCNCSNTNFCNKSQSVELEEVLEETSDEPNAQMKKKDEESTFCKCKCSKCYHTRPENDTKEEEEDNPEHLTHIKHASQFMC